LAGNVEMGERQTGRGQGRIITPQSTVNTQPLFTVVYFFQLPPALLNIQKYKILEFQKGFFSYSLLSIFNTVDG
jgi:hypothetical protein